MKKTVNEILFVMAILFVLGCVFGCKNEAEAKDPNDYAVRKYYCMIPLDCESDDSPYSSEHKCKVTTSALITAAEPEPNEPKPDTSKLVGGLKKIAELIEYYHKRN